MGFTGAELIPLVDCAADHIDQAIRRALQRWREQRRQRPPRNGDINELDYTA
jgi:hypothetical protein